MRLGVYTDYHYWREGDSYYAERAFFTFITSLRPLMDRIVLFGRVNPKPGRSHYRVPDDIDFVALPHYPSLAHPLAALRGMAGSLRRFWRSLDDVDAVWLLGPHLLAIGFAGLAVLRGKRVFLGVRQDLPRYVESRHPGKRWMTLGRKGPRGRPTG